MSQTQVLARKWRPRNFLELTGQEHVVRALTNALEQNRLHHAYLLTGTRGVGKTTIARILAKSLNCEKGVTAVPCGTCAACEQIDAGSFIDLIELDAASNTQVDNMRELLENALYAPTSARFKIYIIDEVHMLSKSAFNAMLKTLEEPPAHVKFVLATTDPQKIPITVLSRCLQFNLKQIPQPQITENLRKILDQENIRSDMTSLQLIARAAQGSMRDALSLLDQAIAFGQGQVEEAGVRDMLGIIDQSYLFDLLDALVQSDGLKLLALADAMEVQCLSFDAALQDLAALLHRIALAQTIPQAISEDTPEYARIIKLAQIFAPDDIQLFYQIALHGRSDLSLAPDEYAGFTMTLLRMLTFMPDDLSSAAQSQRTPSIPIKPCENQDAQRRTEPLQTVEPLSDHTHAPVNVSNLDWPQLIQQLKLSGMAKMLAQHSEATVLSAEKIALCVPDLHKHLLEKKYQEKIQTALNAYLGKSVELNFSVGSVTGLTPVVLQQREEEVKQAQAVAAIEQDPIVQQLSENFDAKLIVSSIKPIQK
ncbi:MAG: DNA polymerase III subunit gamma/tau [Nitrosomonas sp.]|nr:DNA polymerase III subunit gamma/tau [Nitrosomonas sp.]HQV87927.1 DNA polymerase III subunit gamma/tau [Nitrosomonas sp.]